MTQPSLPFGGSTFDPAIDGPRLTKQYELVLALMSDGSLAISLERKRDETQTVGD